MNKQAERLLAKIRAAGVPLPEHVEFRRTYAGRLQREAGAWAWFLLDADTGYDLHIGSQWPQSALTGALDINLERQPHERGDWQIDPVRTHA